MPGPRAAQNLQIPHPGGGGGGGWGQLEFNDAKQKPKFAQESKPL